MLSVKDKGRLMQIIKRCNRIEDKLQNVDKEKFNSNEDIIEVVCFNIFQIGELAGGFEEEFIEKFNVVPWRLIKGMRNRIVHGYDTIDLDIVWNTAEESVPDLKKYCEEILASEK